MMKGKDFLSIEFLRTSYWLPGKFWGLFRGYGVGVDWVYLNLLGCFLIYANIFKGIFKTFIDFQVATLADTKAI